MATKISEVNGRASLETYLEDKPLVLARLIAARCAFRVLPLAGEIFDDKSSDKKRKRNLLLSVLRASFISSTACKYPVEDMRFAAYASAAADAIWREVRVDLLFFDSADSEEAGTQMLLRQRLWSEAPDWFDKAWKSLVGHLRKDDENWNFWIGWFENSAITGRPFHLDNIRVSDDFQITLTQKPKKFLGP